LADPSIERAGDFCAVSCKPLFLAVFVRFCSILVGFGRFCSVLFALAVFLGSLAAFRGLLGLTDRMEIGG
jgi:hypothetical protein